MICPKCGKGELRENVSLRGWIFKKKVYTYICPLCDFRNEHQIRINEKEEDVNVTRRTNLEKKTKRTYVSNRRNYSRRDSNRWNKRGKGR